MKKRSIMSTAAALALVTTLAAPALAATTVGEGGNVSTVITGTIAATQLIVTVPTNVQFSIDPTIDLTSSAAIASGITKAQITQPSENVLKITNGSAVPIYAKVSTVAVSQKTAGTDDVKLVASEAALTDAKSMMFGLKSTAVADFATASDWLVKGAQTGNYLLSADGKMEATGAADSKNELPLTIYGQTQKGWAAGDTFTLTPTIVVSAKANFGAAI